MRKILGMVTAAVLLVTLASGPAGAVDMKGKWGPGVSFETLPLDVKFGISHKSSIFAGIGFADDNVEGHDTKFGLGAGFEYALFGNNDFNLNLQPSFRFFTGDGPDRFEIPLALSAEVWMNDRVSVAMSQGIVFTSVSGENGSDGSSTVDTFGASVTAFRFRFWVK